MTRRLVVWMYAEDAPLWTMPDQAVEEIRSALGEGWEVESVRVPLDATGDGARTTPPEVIAAVRDAEIYCGWGIRPQLFEAARSLRWFHSGAAGVRASLFGAMRVSDVIFTNSAGAYSEPLAEHALAAIFHFSRALDVAVRAQREARWVQRDLIAAGSPLQAGGEVGGSTLGIVGYGGTGRTLARKAAALGMKVQAVRRTAADPELPGHLSGCSPPEGLRDLLGTSDYIVLAAPETAATRKMIGADEVGAMKAGAVFINLSRGSLVDDAPLIAALRAGQLRGAALDVFRTEPLPPDSPWWELENVLVTPHVGGTSGHFWRRQTGLILRNVGRYLAGRRLENLVNKEAGY
ncbi:MAG: D-2-hydroxyacid dehydrogenase [Gemmatimonadetes bacterium]|nr:D-2-hydroxyacid dehydrogenase [Gemmatimonadota bacterium]